MWHAGMACTEADADRVDAARLHFLERCNVTRLVVVEKSVGTQIAHDADALEVLVAGVELHSEDTLGRLLHGLDDVHSVGEFFIFTIVSPILGISKVYIAVFTVDFLDGLRFIGRAPGSAVWQGSVCVGHIEFQTADRRVGWFGGAHTRLTQGSWGRVAP